MRLFTAIAFDATVKSEIAAFCDTLRDAGVAGRFTPPGNLHLTLKFLGEVPPARLAAVKNALCEAAMRIAPFSLRTDRCGSFSVRGDRILWLGMRGEPLSGLAGAVDGAFSQIGFEREKRPFTAHITLLRKAVYNNGDLDRLPARLIPPALVTQVRAATLFESRRENGNLVYHPLVQAPLRG